MLAASVVSTGPTAAGADELDDLRARRDELDTEIAALDAEIDELQGTISTTSADLAATTIRVELVGDELIRMVEARSGPAELQRSAAIESYVFGDPRAQAFLDELQSLGNDNRTTIRRQLYAAVVEDATAELDEIDQTLRDLGQEVVELQERQRDTRDELDQARSALDRRVAARAPLVAERTEVDGRIEFLESLANRPVLTGLPGVNPDRPALVVKIDNVQAARPQAGINQADVVFEELVEGGLTRLAIVLHSTEAPVVGPVRSARTTDVSLLAFLDRPLLSSSGANAVTRDAIAASTLIDIGHPVSPQTYYRDGARRAPHNLFSRSADLWALDGGRAGRPAPLFAYRAPDQPLPASSRPATGVAVNFPNVAIAYDWDGSGWVRTQNGQPHVDADGVVVAPPNVVVQFTEYGTSAADAATPEARVVGGGDAWVFTAGQVVEGRWERDEATDRTIYTTPDGEEVALTPGRTWVEIAPPGSGTIR